MGLPGLQVVKDGPVLLDHLRQRRLGDGCGDIGPLCHPQCGPRPLEGRAPCRVHHQGVKLHVLVHEAVQIPVGIHLLKQPLHLRQLLRRGPVCRPSGGVLLHHGPDLIDVLDLLRPQRPHKVAGIRPLLQQAQGDHLQNGLPHRRLGDVQFLCQLSLHDPVARAVHARGDLLLNVVLDIGPQGLLCGLSPDDSLFHGCPFCSTEPYIVSIIFISA